TSPTKPPRARSDATAARPGWRRDGLRRTLSAAPVGRHGAMLRDRREIVERLSAAGCIAAEDEAAELLAAGPDAATLEGWLRRREQGEPLAWITGRMRFCGQTLRVTAGVYVPRVQSEELARRAASLLPVGGLAVDLCTGAGAIAVHLRAEVPTATVVGVDVDV